MLTPRLPSNWFPCGAHPANAQDQRRAGRYAEARIRRYRLLHLDVSISQDNLGSWLRKSAVRSSSTSKSINSLS